MTASDDQFVLDASLRVFLPIVSGFLVVLAVFGAVAVVSSDVPTGFAVSWVLWGVAVVAQAFRLHFRTPQRIEVSATGLRFVARTRVVDLPWGDLRSIVIPIFDFNHHRLIWRWDGGRVRTWRGFAGIDRLLRIVEERAPHAKLLL